MSTTDRNSSTPDPETEIPVTLGVLAPVVQAAGWMLDHPDVTMRWQEDTIAGGPELPASVKPGDLASYLAFAELALAAAIVRATGPQQEQAEEDRPLRLQPGQRAF